MNAKTHGLSRINGKSNPEYSRWAKMKGRCYCTSDPQYHLYGGRGIIVCKRWFNSFSNFLKDMGPCPEGLSLDRKNNNKGYSKSNCRWATKSEQTFNRRPYKRTRFKTEQVEKKVIKLLAKGLSSRVIGSLVGCSPSTVCKINKGWSSE